MGKRGPLPKTKTAKILTGNFRKDRTVSPGIAPNPNAKTPRMPKDLTPEESVIWRSYAPELSKLGLLDPLSLGPFHVLITMLAHHQAVSEQLDREGLVITSKHGILRPHPLLNVQKKLWTSAFSLMQQFGLTPLSRQRLGVSFEPAPPPQSKLAKYLHDERKKEARFFPDAS